MKETKEKLVGEQFLVSRRSALTAGITAASLLAWNICRPSKAWSVDQRRVFKPGAVWLDTAGKPIQAHGGSIIQVDNFYYWYGENKEFTTGKDDIWTWGVRCYRSQNLYDWEDGGLIVPPDIKDKTSPLHPSALLDRPHIIYNPRTKKFVCWVKLMSKSMEQTRTVLVADKITGPYSLIRKDIHPVGMNAGDYDLVVSLWEAKAYMYFERVHSELICADLTEDFTDFTGYYSTHFPKPGPPDTREGIAYFKRGRKHYLVSSGTTGYFPNPSQVAVGDSFHGPFTCLGDLHPSDRTRTSFNSQICSVFKHPQKKDLFIALADQWMGPMSGQEFETGKLSEIVQNIYRKIFSMPPQPLSEEEIRVQKQMDRMGGNTSAARYVWLPIRFDGERPYIEWREEWSLDEFE